MKLKDNSIVSTNSRCKTTNHIESHVLYLLVDDAVRDDEQDIVATEKKPKHPKQN